MMVMFRLFLCIAMLMGVVVQSSSALADQPITTDSRIKTLVYNANEVFAVTTHYGYQSNIEFGAKETIDTISVGDRVAWQITPSGRRLFIRAQEENAHTNMTVVTNLRAYQFDLRSSAADAVFGSSELTYVVRFFYPEDGDMNTKYVTAAMTAMPPAVPPMPMAGSPYGDTAYVTPAPATTDNLAPLPSGATNYMTASPAPMPVFNYHYTYSGPTDVAPTKIFDDGKSTFFKFTSPTIPRVAIVTAQGEVMEVPARRTSDGLVAVSAVAPRFSITDQGKEVLVYNEAGGVL